MSKDSGQKFISRNRPPRVQITYEDPGNSQKNVELPFVMGVMSDLSGNASDVEKKELADRKFVNVDMDNFDGYMKSVEPAVAFRVKNTLDDGAGEQMGVKLTFKKMDDFSPAAVVRQIPALNSLLEAREQLANLQRYMDGKVSAEAQLNKLLSDPKLMAALSEHMGSSAPAGGEDKKDDKADK
jgi:type VI secretion system protein ImpB